MQTTFVFFDIQKFANFWWKNDDDLTINQGGVTWFINILFPLFFRSNCAKFDHWRIYLTDFMEGNLCFPHLWAATKRPIVNWVNGAGYCCIIKKITKSEAVSLLQIANLIKKVGQYKTYFSLWHIKYRLRISKVWCNWYWTTKISPL